MPNFRFDYLLHIQQMGSRPVAAIVAVPAWRRKNYEPTVIAISIGVAFI